MASKPKANLSNQDVATWPVNQSSGVVKRAYRGCVSNTLRVVVENGAYKPPEGWTIESVRVKHGETKVRVSRSGE